MKTTLNRESASKVRLTVEASAAEVKPWIDRAVRELGSQVKIPGFRKGHVPRQILETRLGRDALREAILREAIPPLLTKAVETETLMPLAPPSVEVQTYEVDADLTFDATVEVRPEVELPDLAGIPVTRPSTRATPEEVDEQLERLRDRFATLETVQRPARRGDFVQLDINVSLHGERIEALSGADQLYEIGSEWVVGKLDDELENARAGDILKFNATLGDNVPEEWRAKEVTFQVLVKEVRYKALPTLDDEFAKTASELETLAELRADIEERLRKVKAMQADVDVRQKVLEWVVEEVEVEPPESLVDQEMAYRVARLEDQLRAAGVSIDQYMESTGTTAEQLEAELRAQGERSVRAQLILEELARREELKASEEDLREEIRYHAETLREDPAKLAESLKEGGRLLTLAGDIIRRKALNLLVERADIKEEDLPADDSADEPGERSEATASPNE